MSAPAFLTADQVAFVNLANTLKAQERAEIRISVVGVVGIALLGTAFWIWRRR